MKADFNLCSMKLLWATYCKVARDDSQVLSLSQARFNLVDCVARSRCGLRAPRCVKAGAALSVEEPAAARTLQSARTVS